MIPNIPKNNNPKIIGCCVKPLKNVSSIPNAPLKSTIKIIPKDITLLIKEKLYFVFS